jgi:hypothetical protein
VGVGRRLLHHTCCSCRRSCQGSLQITCLQPPAAGAAGPSFHPLQVMLWEGYAREEARAGDPAKLRKMRRQIQAALNRMAQQQQVRRGVCVGGGGGGRGNRLHGGAEGPAAAGEAGFGGWGEGGGGRGEQVGWGWGRGAKGPKQQCAAHVRAAGAVHAITSVMPTNCAAAHTPSKCWRCSWCHNCRPLTHGKRPVACLWPAAGG